MQPQGSQAGQVHGVWYPLAKNNSVIFFFPFSLTFFFIIFFYLFFFLKNKNKTKQKTKNKPLWTFQCHTHYSQRGVGVYRLAFG